MVRTIPRVSHLNSDEDKGLPTHPTRLPTLTWNSKRSTPHPENDPATPITRHWRRERAGFVYGGVHITSGGKKKKQRREMKMTD
jgi:hypothetical protein